MKIKNLIISLISVLVLISFTACDFIAEKNVKPVSEISIFPIFVFNGGQTMVHILGTTWTDPGVLVSEIKEGDNELAGTLVVDDSEMDVNTRGLYTIKYTATNSYGYSLTANRYVLVTSDVSNLYDISGTYYQGFNPNPDGSNLMTITQNEIKGFWDVSNIIDLSKPTSGYIADFGNLNYGVALALYKRKISNLRYTYLTGTAEYDNSGSPEKLVFSLTEVYDDGTPIGIEKHYTWNKLENK